jgi:broad specificity phosphatase PhoE
MPTVYLITHPEVVIDPQVPVPQWPLSERGRERMRRCLAQPWIMGIRAVHCSGERKAMDGAAILAQHVGCQPQVWEALGEVDRSSTGYIPREEHEALARLLCARPEESVRGWERASDAQRRISSPPLGRSWIVTMATVPSPSSHMAEWVAST